MTPKQIFDKIDSFCLCDSVVLTGGEPAFQDYESLSELILLLKKNDFYVAIETNGTLRIPAFDIDWISCSPKTKISNLWLHYANEIKIVLKTGQNPPDLLGRFNDAIKYVQPMADGLKVNVDNLNWCIDYVKSNPEWRLSLQMHKMIGVK